MHEFFAWQGQAVPQNVGCAVGYVGVNAVVHIRSVGVDALHNHAWAEVASLVVMVA